MAQDSENRLKKIMDKLYHTPRPRVSALSSAGSGNVIASRSTAMRALASGGPADKAASCRPWDRSDLFRRLATFKAMTWFGKPKDISSLNCARRGWINFEMDVIVCEACGARLLFSTPPSWALEQVEKAAAVFSLKLDNGHKLLCPWINNTCDESLASFPPSPPQVLIERFNERSHTLLRLTALPAISSLTIECMRGPQLDCFLSAPFHSAITLSNGIRLTDDCINKDLYDAVEDGDSHSYYQALKIISLCGWEPRLLPYNIELEGNNESSTKTTNPSELSIEMPFEQTQNITNCSSTVLDCRFCGACAGLWFFKAIPRPLEFFKIIIDGSCQNELVSGTADLTHNEDAPRIGRGDHGSNMEKPVGLHLTIAGGPPPTKQHFRPKISLPAVSRYMRAELSYNYCSSFGQGSSGMEDHDCQKMEFDGHNDAGSGSLKRKRDDAENSNSQLHNLKDAISKLITEESTPCSDVIVMDDVAFHCGSMSKVADAVESNDANSILDESNFGETRESDGCDPSVSASTSVTNVNSSNNSKAIDKGSCLNTDEGMSVGKQESLGLVNKVSISIAQAEDVDNLPGNLKPTLLMDFDPMKQHRPFCPWISEEGKNVPGWKATLSALYNLSQKLEQNEAASSLLDEVDDPIVSVRKLFTTPPSKRFKGC